MPRLPLLLFLPAALFAQNPDSGRTLFEGHCAQCHGRNGNGGELGPSILTRIGTYTDAELATLIHEGLPNSGMPRTELSKPKHRRWSRFSRR